MDGEVCVGLFALRDIASGEELTYDYNFQTFSEKKQECLCGSVNCRGFLVRASEGREAQKQLVIKEKENQRLAKRRSRKKADAVVATTEGMMPVVQTASGAATSKSGPKKVYFLPQKYAIILPQRSMAPRVPSSGKRLADHITLLKKRETFDIKFLLKNKGFVIQTRVMLLRSFRWLMVQNDLVSGLVWF